MRAGTRVTHAEGHVRHPPCVAYDPHRGRAAARRHEDRRPAEGLLGDGRDGPHERGVGGAAVRVLALLRAELDVAETAPVEVSTQECRDLLRVLIGHEAEVDLSRRFRWYDRFRSRSVVAGLDAADVARRLEDRRALGIRIIAAESEALDANDVSGRLGVERHALEHGAVGVGRLAHVVVEAIDLHPAFRVHERRECLRETRGGVRVMRGAAGVRVAGHGANAEVAVEDPLAAQREDRTPFAVERAAFLQRTVGIGQSRLEREEPREVRAA